MPTVAFKAERMNRLRLRFSKALEKIWIADENMPDRPGLHRDYLFDFESGMRLLISRDKFPMNEKPEIHVSASWEYNPPQSVEEMHLAVIEGYKSLGGFGILKFIGFSSNTVPHWIVEAVN